MTDKQIIIDGLDVSECEYSFKQFDNWVGKDVVLCNCTLGYRCEPKENHCKFYMCYLEQQLKRKEQECDKLKQALAEIKEIAEWHTTSADSEDVQEDMKQILQKISGCEI